jgi:hypothetical protein
MIQTFSEFGNYSHFNPVVLGSEDLFQLHESNSMAKYGLSDFKSLFRGALLESEGYVDDQLLERAHVCYELDMLAESKSHWFSDDGEVVKIDAGDHIILIKNNEAYIVSSNTLNSINEFWSWNDAKNAWHSLKKNVTAFAVEKYKQAKGAAIKAWDAISDGAKKAWEFVKSCAAAAVKFLSEMTWVEWASLGLSVTSAILGIIGAGIPGVTVAAGVCMALNGSIHLYEGWHKYHEAQHALEGIDDVSKFAKNSAAITKALPNAIMGTLFMALGFYDISHGLTEALVNPAAGSISAVIKGGAVSAGKGFIGEMTHNMEHLLGGFVTKAVQAVGGKVSGKVAEKAGVVLLTVFGEAALSKILGWLWKGLMQISKAILTGIQFLLDLPAKISDAITSMQKNAKGVIGSIAAKGLASIVKPMADGAAKAIAKYIKPFIDKAKNWVTNQIAAYDVCVAEMQHHKEEFKGNHEVKETKGKPLYKPMNLKAEGKDLKRIKKLPKINKEIKKAASGKGYHVGKKNESEEYNLSRILPFEQFSLNLSI